MKGTLHSILVVTTLCGFATIVLADQIYVPQDYSSIQAAINAASDGDEIVVDDGTYHEVIDFLGKAVTLQSANGPELTIIDGSDLCNSVVTCASGEGPDTLLEGFTIKGGTGDTFGADYVGGGMYNAQSSPTVIRCKFTENSADRGAGMFNIGSDATVIDCVFLSNSGSLGGGVHNWGGSAKMINCRFDSNIGQFFGGGIYNEISSPVIINCTFYANAAGGGGALDNSMSTPLVMNCTFSMNYAQYGGGLRSSSNGSPAEMVLVNCIVWDNSPDQILDLAGAQTTVYFSDVEGMEIEPDSGNMNQDPLFVDGWSGDLRLLPGSPCIDAGDTMAFLEFGLDHDLDGNPRPVDGSQGGGDGGPGLFRRCYRVDAFLSKVDMGAYEYQPQP